MSTVPADEGHPVHYSAVPRGTPVYSSEGTEVGRVREILDNRREHIFDGVVFTDGDGEPRFVDAPEVARTAERAVTLSIDAKAARQLGPPEKGARIVPGLTGGLGRLFGARRR